MKWRTIFLSDLHLGLPAARADLVLDFLNHNSANTIYLVGDIVDLWTLRRKGYWPPLYNKLLERLQMEIKVGTRVVYLPGNHDTFLRNINGSFAGIEFANTIIHKTADGKKFLVMHGDSLDYVSSHIKWLAYLGDWVYDKAIDFSAWLTKIRSKLGYPHWSFSQWAKARIKQATAFLEGYETLLKCEAKKYGCDGVIVGHVHTPIIRVNDDFTYCCCGDFVESCAALVEYKDGKLEIIHWGPDRLTH